MQKSNASRLAAVRQCIFLLLALTTLCSCATRNTAFQSERFSASIEQPSAFKFVYFADPRISRENLSDRSYEAYEDLGYFRFESSLSEFGVPYLQNSGFGSQASVTANPLHIDISASQIQNQPGLVILPLFAVVTLYDAKGDQRLWTGQFRFNLGSDPFWGGIGAQHVDKRFIEKFLFLILKQMEQDRVIPNKGLVAPI